jgi:ribose transport system permease protein
MSTETPVDEGNVGMAFGDRAARSSQIYLVLGFTVLVTVVGALTNDKFLSADNFTNLLRLSAPFGILAVGQAIVVMGKGIDLSSAAIALGLSQATLSFVAKGMAETQAMALMMVIAIVIGVANGWLVAYVGVPALFATLATGLLTIGVANIFLIDENYYQLADDALLRQFASGYIAGVPRAIAIAALVFVVAGIFIALTAHGKLIRAIGDNAATARETGAPVRPLQMLSYVVSSIIAIVAGWVVVSLGGGAQTTQTPFGTLLFTALTITVIGGVSLSGGRGSVFGIFVGLLFVSVLNNLLLLYGLTAPQQDIVRSVVLLGAVALDARLYPRDEETAKSGEL